MSVDNIPVRRTVHWGAVTAREYVRAVGGSGGVPAKGGWSLGLSPFVLVRSVTSDAGVTSGSGVGVGAGVEDGAGHGHAFGASHGGAGRGRRRAGSVASTARSDARECIALQRPPVLPPPPPRRITDGIHPIFEDDYHHGGAEYWPRQASVKIAMVTVGAQTDSNKRP